ncbi:hypothetical protein [Pseudonocardia hierapolitana]|nr:hypothetical protein [Pseudonocardia hierapolitana]
MHPDHTRYVQLDVALAFAGAVKRVSGARPVPPCAIQQIIEDLCGETAQV